MSKAQNNGLTDKNLSLSHSAYIGYQSLLERLLACISVKLNILQFS